MTPRPRIAGLLEAGLALPSDGLQELTPEGRPWVRWAKIGEHAGWYYVGTRPAVLPTPPSFWDVVFVLATELGSARVDAAHCVGPGILSLGGTGITLASGYGAALLCECLAADPFGWLQAMGGLVHAAGVYPACSRSEVQHREDCCFVEVEGAPLTRIEELEKMVRTDAGGWTGAAKRRARRWVESVGRLLFQPAMDQAQTAFCRKHVPTMLDDLARQTISWPPNGADDAWQWTREQQALWAVAMVAAMADGGLTLSMVFDCVATEPADAKRSMVSMRARCSEPRSTREREDQFNRRVLHAVSRVQDIYGFRLEDA